VSAAPTAAEAHARPPSCLGMPIVDCDVHAVVPSVDTLFGWLSPHWQEVATTTQFRGPTDTAYPPSAATSLRPDLVGESGVAESLDDLRARSLDPWDVEAAILVCAYGTEAIKNPDAAAALSTAANSWVAERWLADEPRLHGSIVVPGLDPQAAAREVERASEHPGFVQVVLPVRSFAPYGNRIWWPLLDAITRRGLVLALQFGGASGHPATSVGWPTTYLEEYVAMAGAYQAQLTSLVAEGTFERYPSLRVICLESGFAWLPSLLWRLDRLWRGLRREIPWTRRAPSAYIREHIRLTTQPFDGPRDAAGFARLIDQIGSEEMLCFATDYPHWHHDSAAEAIPPLPDGAALRAVMAGNARRLYRLEAPDAPA
jgi:predicted TIM-barrel fold metal-dependent hydrolase